MPWKNPDNWLASEVMAPILAFLFALLRMIYFENDVKWQRVLVESVLCAMVALTAWYGVTAMGLHDRWAVVIGTLVSLHGLEYLRDISRRLIEKKVDKQ